MVSFLSIWRGAIVTRGPRLPAIAAEVAGRHGIPVEVMLGRSRKASVVAARFHFFWAMRTFTDMSLPEIGRRVGFDHATVRHGALRWSQMRFDFSLLDEVTRTDVKRAA